MSAAQQGAPLRFGVLGCADIAWRRMLPVLSAAPDVEVVAVASRELAKAQRFTARFGGRAVEGYEALLAARDVDAVYVPLPAMLHAEWVARALRAGKHVLVEKPLTGTAAETVRLLESASARGLVLVENVAFPHHALHADVTDRLARGAIGRLRGFGAAFTIPPLPPSNVRHLPKVGGGALLDIGIYPVRAALEFCGPDLEVVGAVLREHGRTGAVVSGRVLLATSQGVTADLFFGMEHSYRNAYEFAGSAGRLSVDRVFTPPPSYRPVVRIERQDHCEEFVVSAGDQFAAVVARFAAAVRSGGDAGGLAEASVRQARLVTAIEEEAVRVTV
ncbi:Gfo/Idh/MocA family oxidoreductase [Streptomyces sp. NPDC047315]|uniref:Gfo/Idh/MocA family protein n=1 Tax=Streptomyces sp. NPDC047315 TaxID=3155142 RepID=UPI0033FAE458